MQLVTLAAVLLIAVLAVVATLIGVSWNPPSVEQYTQDMNTCAAQIKANQPTTACSPCRTGTAGSGTSTTLGTCPNASITTARIAKTLRRDDAR